MEQVSEFRSMRAPQGDGQSLIDPPFSTLPAVVVENRRRVTQAEYDLQGRSLAALSLAARGGLLQQAVAFTRRYRDLPPELHDTNSISGKPFLLSGHQPQLFHPGVWYKNFVLGTLTRRMRGIGVHLLIDSDLCRSVSIRVPNGSAERPRVEAVAYDEPAAEVPYEERTIRSESTLASFADRAATLIRPLVPDPLVESLWSLMYQRDPKESNLGLRLAQARHALEAEWQNDTLELPQSTVCQLPEFAWFLAHLLAHLPRFWSAYNDALADYRSAHRQRSGAHPVPDLAEVDGWLEAPFWIWSADDPQRRPLFARQSGDEILVSDRASRMFRLTLSADRDAATAVEQLVELSAKGVKIRTRALTTTLFARLILSDLFLHGIGGAKYDQVTDQIAASFFGFRLPDFAVVSATLRLPIAGQPTELPRTPACTHRLRELRYHPERYVDVNSSTDDALQISKIIAEKRHWIQAPKSPANARERHLAIVAANEALQPYVASEMRDILDQCESYQQHQRADMILHSRDYSFCLYPRRHFEDKLLRELQNT